MKKLSVIIPAREEADNLPTCIRGIDRELEKHDAVREILVIDDGSIDNTLEVIKNFHAGIPSNSRGSKPRTARVWMSRKIGTPGVAAAIAGRLIGTRT